jgi:hypothetical protein
MDQIKGEGEAGHVAYGNFIESSGCKFCTEITWGANENMER